ncbi:TetR family transcriptional regulator [Alkalibaculum sporogenes]|uniref:TetR family transcriptional regulator n=1 Tax=Alkalibaculum sporogenes TaxID=2655001 RepID=UPI00187BBED8
MKKEGMTNRKIMGAKTKNNLYRSAEKLFELYDFNNVSVNDITKSAGVSKATFYVHFESKDELITSLIADYVKTTDLKYQSYMDSLPKDMPSLERMLLLIEKISNVLVDNIGHARMCAVYKIQLTRSVNMENIKDYGRELYKIFAAELNEGIQNGEFKTDLSLEQLTRHLVMAIRGICYEWCIRYPDFDLKGQALTHFSMLLASIGDNK